MAERLGMSVDECSESHTELQIAVWHEHFRQEMERPGRVEWYLMQVAAEVFRGHAKHPDRVSANDFRLRFEQPGGPKIDEKFENDIATTKWLGALGMTEADLPDEVKAKLKIYREAS